MLKRLFSPFVKSSETNSKIELFIDLEWYNDKYKTTDGVNHFIKTGYEQNFNLNELVNTKNLKEKYQFKNIRQFLTKLETKTEYLSEKFDPKVYLEKNDDLKEAGVVPLSHFIKHGRFENRIHNQKNNVNAPKQIKTLISIKDIDVKKIDNDDLTIVTKDKATIVVSVNKTEIGKCKLIRKDGKKNVYRIKIPFIINDKFIFCNEEQELKLVINNSIVIKEQVLFQPIDILRVDKVEKNRIHGWLYSKDNITDIIVKVDGVIYTEEKANIFRADLKKLGISEDGKLGYEIRFPTDIKLDRVTLHYGTDRLIHDISKNKKVLDVDEKYSLGPLMKNHFNEIRKTSIIIPVYNAYEDVKRCITSVLKHTNGQVELIIINDCSTDKEIEPFLNEYKDIANITIIHNEVNLGYTKSINKGIAKANENDVVLLNSDTIVSERWLDELILKAYSKKIIGTVTAVSNGAGAFSVPEIGYNELPYFITLDELALINRHVAIDNFITAPTGNGFCIYIKKTVFDTIGFFDEEKFPMGYGEENEFCMRLKEAGFLNVIAPKAYVYHKRSASFKESKVELVKQGRIQVDKSFPSYGKEVREFLNDVAFKNARFNIRKALITIEKRPKLRILYVISTVTGGTPQTNRDLMSASSNYVEPLLLHCDSEVITFSDGLTGKVFFKHNLKNKIKMADLFSEEYDEFVMEKIYLLGIDIIHIRHLAWHSNNLPKIGKKLNLPVIYSLHDFYSICPTVNLLDENLKFCGGICTKSEGECEVGIWGKDPNKPKIKHEYIHTWQRRFENIIPFVDTFITTAQSGKDIISEIYPSILQKPFVVIPHGRNFTHLNNEGSLIASRIPSSSEKIKILILGNTGESKGASFIKEIKKADSYDKIEFHFLGSTRHFLSSCGVTHGRYNREELHLKLKEIKPHFVGLFSIWHETYCHTLTEAWTCGIPVLTFGLGAIEERVKKHGGAWILKMQEANNVLDKIIKIARDPIDYSEKIQEILKWQTSHIRQNSTFRMASFYKEIYLENIAKKKAFNKEYVKPKRVGIFTGEAPTSHIRVREWIDHSISQTKITPLYLDADVYLNDSNNILELDYILIQRNNLDISIVDAVLEIAQSKKHKIIFEIDDDLININEETDINGIYGEYKEAIKKLVINADKVSVSNFHLKNLLKPLNDEIFINKNVIDEFKWFKPVSKKDLNLTAELKLLYMGNSTHEKDLNLIRSAVENLKEQGHSIELYLIGGISTWLDEDEPWYTRISIPKECTAYNKFVNWFRSISDNFDVALAPLQESEFNKSKSNLKFLQYSAVGLPTIASDVIPYKNIIRQEDNGLLISNTTEAWETALFMLLSKKHLDNLKNNIAPNAQQLIKEEFLLKNNIATFLNMFND